MTTDTSVPNGIGIGRCPPVASIAMGEAPRPAAERWVFAFAAVSLLTTVLIRIIRTDRQMLWLDELYSSTLIGTDSLRHLWDGVIRGLDGNPPLYLTIGWLLTHTLDLPVEPALRGFNLLIVTATVVIIYRICRRIGDPGSVMLALLLIAAIEPIPIYVVLELRTYALYLAAVSASLLMALRLSERPAATGRSWSFAAAGCLATLAHTFGGFYVLAITAALASAAFFRGDRILLRRSIAGGLPATVLLLLWLRFFLPAIGAVSSPYGWIRQPDFIDLAVGLTGSFWISAVILAVGLGMLAAGRATLAGLPGWLADPDRPAVLIMALKAFAGLTLGVWLASHVITPSFALRYFIPNLTVAAAFLTGFLVCLRPLIRPQLLSVLALIAVIGALNRVWTADREGSIPCLASDGSFLEASVATGWLPVVLESTHSWLPRHTYALGYRTLYPLDWDVVLKYPNRSRSNATDYNLMRILRDWVRPDDPKRDELLTTEQILVRYPSFLVVNESWLSWFDNLRATHPLTATLLKEGSGCKVWQVDQRS